MKDLLFLEEELSEEERLVRASVRQFVEKEAMPLLTAAYERGVFPQELIPKIAALGLLGMTLPQAYGGSGASPVSYALACQELERGDSGLRSFVSVQSSLCMYPIYRYGTEEQKQRYLPKMAAGEWIACFGLTEANAGSDPSSMRTRAQKVKQGWILNGSKQWITNAPLADLAIVWAQTEDGIRGFIVEKEFTGFQRLELTHKMSLRCSSTGELVFTDCLVPERCLLPGTEVGLRAPLSCLTEARFGIAWGAMGAAMACYEAAVNYTGQRHQFGQPLAAKQLVQKDLADMLTEIVKAQCLNLQIGRLKKQGKVAPAIVSLAKMNACREALKIARMARNLLGANGISLHYHVIRHMMNLESVFTYEGTDNIHHLILGKQITGIEAF